MLSTYILFAHLMSVITTVFATSPILVNPSVKTFYLRKYEWCKNRGIKRAVNCSSEFRNYCRDTNPNFELCSYVIQHQQQQHIVFNNDYHPPQHQAVGPYGPKMLLEQNDFVHDADSQQLSRRHKFFSLPAQKSDTAPPPNARVKPASLNRLKELANRFMNRVAQNQKAEATSSPIGGLALNDSPGGWQGGRRLRLADNAKKDFYSTELDVNLERNVLAETFESDILLNERQAKAIEMSLEESLRSQLEDSFAVTPTRLRQKRKSTSAVSQVTNRNIEKTLNDTIPASQNHSFTVSHQLYVSSGLKVTNIAPSKNKSRNDRVKRKIAIDAAFQLWNKFPIPYQFHPDVGRRVRSVVRHAVKLWERNTCARWQENGPGTDRIEFTDGMGCSSFVGRSGGTQEISISSRGCDRVGIVSHELGHSLGFFHEQNRPDQADHVTINYPNILPNYYNNFVAQHYRAVATHATPYDFGSVMHYDGWTKGFTLSSRDYAILARDPMYQATMGQRNGPSFVDFKQANMHYCSNRCRNVIKCAHGGYPNPNRCRRCTCPEGFGGRTCNSVALSDAACGGTLNAQKVHKRFGRLFPGGSIVAQKRGYSCNWMIKPGKVGSGVKNAAAPNVKHKLFAKFIGNFRINCTEPCSHSFVEVKTGANDFQSTGYRLCCNERPEQTFESESGLLLFIFRAEPSINSAVGSKLDQEFRVEYWAEPMEDPNTATSAEPKVNPNNSNNANSATGTSEPTTINTTPSATTLPPTTTLPTTTVVESGTTEPPIPSTFKPLSGNVCEDQCMSWTAWSSCDYDCGGCGSTSRGRSCSLRKDLFSKNNEVLFDGSTETSGKDDLTSRKNDTVIKNVNSDDTECHDLERRRCNFDACRDVSVTKPGVSARMGKSHFLYAGCCLGLFRTRNGSCGGLATTVEKLYERNRKRA